MPGLLETKRYTHRRTERQKNKHTEGQRDREISTPIKLLTDKTTRPANQMKER